MSKEAMKLALEALKQIDEAMPFPVAKLAQAALREALEEQPAQQEPVAFYRCNGCGHAYEQVHPTSCDCMEAGGFDRVEYYTSPPAQRTWVGLTDWERNSLWRDVIGWGDPSHDDENLMKAIEAKLKEKNA